MISEAELAQMKERYSPYEGCFVTPKEGERLIREVEELRAALRDMRGKIGDWVEANDTYEVISILLALDDIARAALGETA